MAKEPIPDSIKHPLSMKPDYADPFLYGGVAAIVGIVGIIAGAVILLVWNPISGGILAGLGIVLFLAGFFVARRGD